MPRSTLLAARQLIDYGARRIADFDFDRLAAQVEQLYRSLRP